MSKSKKRDAEKAWMERALQAEMEVDLLRNRLGMAKIMLREAAMAHPDDGLGLALRYAIARCDGKPMLCCKCGKRVEPGREDFAHPICHDCLPPPEPLPVLQPKEG